jgi:hypothetical protein
MSKPLVDINKEAGEEVNDDKTKDAYRFMSRHQKAGQNQNITINNFWKLWQNSNIWERHKLNLYLRIY